MRDFFPLLCLNFLPFLFFVSPALLPFHVSHRGHPADWIFNLRQRYARLPFLPAGKQPSLKPKPKKWKITFAFNMTIREEWPGNPGKNNIWKKGDERLGGRKKSLLFFVLVSTRVYRYGALSSQFFRSNGAQFLANLRYRGIVKIMKIRKIRPLQKFAHPYPIK